MEGRYYIIILEENENGNIIRDQLFEFPNGTPFNHSPIHINSKQNIIVSWAKNNAEKYMDLNGLTIIPTDETEKISITTIAKGLNISPNNIPIISVLEGGYDMKGLYNGLNNHLKVLNRYSDE